MPTTLTALARIVFALSIAVCGVFLVWNAHVLLSVDLSAGGFSTLGAADAREICDDARTAKSWFGFAAAMLSFLCGAQGLTVLNTNLAAASTRAKVALGVVMVVVGTANAGVTFWSNEAASRVADVCPATEGDGARP